MDMNKDQDKEDLGFEERLQQPLSFQQSLFNQIERINQFAAQSLSNESMSSAYFLSIEQLSNLLTPFKDRIFNERITQLLSKKAYDESNIDKEAEELREELFIEEGLDHYYQRDGEYWAANKCIDNKISSFKEQKLYTITDIYWQSVFTECISLMNRVGLLSISEERGKA